jgi:2-polyprenyl-6-methoxyphenol hydroxylase-like FAD-dependent oxidoreductase
MFKKVEMTMSQNENTCWTVCPECKGRGKKSRRLSKKAKLSYKISLDQFEKTNNADEAAPARPKGHLYFCLNCNATGIIRSVNYHTVDKENYPHVAIVGGGIGGVALAVACLHRGIPFTLYERDDNFNARAQGYGLTLQQASKAIAAFGILSLKDGVISTKHIVHTTDGKIIGEWGLRKWLPSHTPTSSKRTNVHIARQSLRLALLEQLSSHDAVQWGHQLVDLRNNDADEIELHFQVNDVLKCTKADLVVGADGIRSTVRKLLIGDEVNPLRYLGCMVILGICRLDAIQGIESPLLDSATVFQTANGKERIYIMPYSSDSVMWQLSFPIPEEEAKALSTKGTHSLKQEARKKTPWHAPVPQIIEATPEAQISGYPVYDRELMDLKLLEKLGKVTLIGDAAHPMSPFKGQGANQALLDALSLARAISTGCNPLSQWRKVGIRKSVLNSFESEMLERCASKVKESKEAAQFLHSESVLQEVDEPRRWGLSNNKV